MDSLWNDPDIGETTADQKVWQIRPAFVMPSMTCETQTAEQILFLAQWAPAWALARVFEKEVMTIYRVCLCVGRDNLVGTTVKTPALPPDVAADEKHTHLVGAKVYVAATVAEHFFLGGSVSPNADETHLTAAYQQFQHEAQQVQPTDHPKTVNTDGWQATMKAWQTLFPQIPGIHCFLHAMLNLRQVTTKAMNALYQEMADLAWHVYRATTKASFSQRFRRLREWGARLTESPLKEQLVKRCRKKAGFLAA